MQAAQYQVMIMFLTAATACIAVVMLKVSRLLGSPALLLVMQAARYQIMIMFLIAATTCIAVVGAVYLAVLNIMDRQHRLCSEKILPKASTGSGVEHWIQGQTIRVLMGSYTVTQHIVSCL